MAKTALVVDDSNTMRDMISLSLRGAGFDVLLAEDGQEALNVIAGKHVDVVITDINMPNMNGIDLIKNLRSDPDFKFIPILVLTTESGDSMKMQGKEAGASGWIVKPFNPETLIGAVNKVCP